MSKRNILLIFFVSAFLTGCDILGEDSIDDNQARVELTDGPIVVTPQSSGIIDISSLITTSGSHRFSITSPPKLGKILSLGNDLLQYTPNSGVTEGRDGFTLSFYGGNNTIISEDSVTIIITADSTAYPCGLWAFNDGAFLKATTIIIDVLANDIACNVDKSLLQVSLPDITINGVRSFQSAFGTVQVLDDGQISYTKGPKYIDRDFFYYSITKPADVPNVGDREETSYAMVSIITAYGVCDVHTAMDDFYTVDIDSLVFDSITVDTVQLYDTVYLDVVANDYWCMIDSTYVEIVEYPQGQVWQLPNYPRGFFYIRPSNALYGSTDKFRYKYCFSPGRCKEAEVTIQFE
jgi:hypothetical protein